MNIYTCLNPGNGRCGECEGCLRASGSISDPNEPQRWKVWFTRVLALLALLSFWAITYLLVGALDAL